MQEKLQNSKVEEEYLSRGKLKERGWTDRIIKNFMPLCDKEKKNPYYASAYPMKLYLLERVKQIENTDKFKKEFTKSQPRKKASKRAVETKLKKIRDYIKNLKIIVKKMPINLIQKKAIKDYNDFKEAIEIERGDIDYQRATINSDILFLNRICVNYIRHNLTIYENELEKIFGKVGSKEAYRLLNEKIYSVISSTYPTLSDECSNQLLRKNGE
jgi:hypothetical protein